MRNYRTIAANNSYLTALGSGQSQANVFEPELYNDAGIYSHFYINFKKPLNPFSIGMLLESIQVLPGSGSTPLRITSFSKVSDGLYKIACNISGQQNVIVVNREDGWLTFASGGKVPPFSASFDVAGALIFVKMAYVYDVGVMGDDYILNPSITIAIGFDQYVSYEQSEVVAVNDINHQTMVENVTVSYWQVAP